MNVTYAPDIEANPALKSALLSREADIRAAFGAEPADAEAAWTVLPGAGYRNLFLTVRSGDQQAAEPIPSSELANGAFGAKLERIKEAMGHNAIWKRAVHQLMADVRVWCQDLPNVSLRDESVTLYEERGGRYDLPALEIRSASRLMWVKPVAGWVVDPTGIDHTRHRAIGRADLRGAGGPIYLYYLVPDGQWVYAADALAPNGNPNLLYPLTSDDFLKLAQVCLDG